MEFISEDLNSEATIFAVTTDSISLCPNSHEACERILTAFKKLDTRDTPTGGDLKEMSMSKRIFQDFNVTKGKAVFEEAFSSPSFPLVISNDSLVSVPLTESLLSEGGSFGVVSFDAKSNSRHIFNKTKMDASCVNKRLADLCTTTLIGVREILSGDNVSFENLIFLEDILEDEDIEEEYNALIQERVVITINLNTLDARLFHDSDSQSTPEGFEWKQLCSILQWIFKNRSVAAVHIHGLCPSNCNTQGDHIAASVVKQLLIYQNLYGKS